MPAHHNLSVVMSVYNHSDQLEKSIESILNQSHADFELIIINDGSTDNTQQVLQGFAANDSRINIIQQANMGLTRALITGCNQSKASYIARHDVGDYSTPDRFEKQLDYLKTHNDCAVVFSHFRGVDQSGNVVYRFTPSAQSVQSSIDIDNNDISTPSHHGCAMFNKASYVKAGGYRPEFYLTQDLDLWIRLSEHGHIHVIEDSLYDALIATDTLSGKYSGLQKQYHDIIIESAQLRRKGLSDAAALTKADAIRPTANTLQLKQNASNTLYFMASCLLETDPALAKTYLKQALKKNPAHLKAWYKLVFKT